MFDNTLLKTLDKMVKKEKIAKFFSRRLRVKGILTAKSETKKGNLHITVQKSGQKYRLIIPKTHQERYALASKLPLNSTVSVEGIKSKFMIICVKIKALEAIDESRQSELNGVE